MKWWGGAGAHPPTNYILCAVTHHFFGFIFTYLIYYMILAWIWIKSGMICVCNFTSLFVFWLRSCLCSLPLSLFSIDLRSVNLRSLAGVSSQHQPGDPLAKLTSFTQLAASWTLSRENFSYWLFHKPVKNMQKSMKIWRNLRELKRKR